MALSYAYKVKDRSGHVVDGAIEGDSLGTVVGKLRQMGYTVLNVQEKSEAKQAASFQLFKKKVKIKQDNILKERLLQQHIEK